jgi:glycosyltransferase involved in cell wall biosynthesis
MKIAIVNNFFAPRVGGSSHVAEQLAKHFVKLGHEVLVVTGQYSDSPSSQIKDGYRIRRLPTWILPKSKLSLNFDINFALLPGNARKMKRILDEFKPDLIHCHGQFLDLSWKALRYSKRRSVPTVLTLHTRLVNPNRVMNFLLFLLDIVVVNPRLKRNKPKSVIIIDKEFEKYALNRYGFDSSVSKFIPIGVDLDKFKQFGFVRVVNVDQEIVILSIGHVIPIRNRITLIEALPKVLEAFPNVKIKIIGNVYQESFLEKARKLNVLDRIEALGACPSHEIPTYLRQATLEIHDVQGFGVGIASLEAMYAGVPTIMATDLDYFPHAHLIPDTHFIRTVPNDPAKLASSIIGALHNDDLLARISAEGQKYVAKNFDFKEIAIQHIEIFDHITGRSI